MIHYTFFLEKKRYFGDLENNSNVTLLYRNSLFKSILAQKLFNLVFSRKVNKTFKSAGKLKALFYKRIVQLGYIGSDTIVFIFHAGWYDESFIKWIKDHFKNVILILYFEDTVSLYIQTIPDFNPYDLKKQFNYIYSFNPPDVKKYGFIPCNAYFSRFNEHDLPQKEEYFDIVFIGAAKDRLDIIFRIYERLSKRCKCNFIVLGSPSKRKALKGIKFINKTITYQEYLSYEINAKCILEILKKDTAAQTFRCWEAVYYNKKLITNWKGIKDFKYYNPRFMMYFDNEDNIDVDFITEDITPSYEYQNDNSPNAFLKKIIDNIQRDNLTKSTT